MSRTKTKTANRLINEKSPYLLQHAYNPVDWYPWGEEAFARAKAEDKPVFLSIGYSSCHWCHVMERESFADPAVAELLNRDFISIKVDREERPDLDHIYMAACQALTGQGGWPLTVFLTPDKKPFFAGTYFPKRSRYGIIGLEELLPKLASLWKREPEKLAQAGEKLLRSVQDEFEAGAAKEMPGIETLDMAFDLLQESFDRRYGGFGPAPKFPIPHQLMFLLRYWKRSGKPEALEMVVRTLEAMAAGGICDQLGYGFHRYSTDAAWLVPHFEKMLYDQALLALAYLEGYQAARDPELAAAARQIFEYVLRDLTSPEGAFYTAEDADAEGEEGLFYLWTRAEIMDLLGEKRGRIVADYYHVTAAGNFKNGKNILHLPVAKQEFAAARGMDITALNEILSESREILLQARSRRERPFRDDKIITGWNGLMIAALARGAAALAAPLYASAARKAALFIRKHMVDQELGLRRRYREGEAAYPAFLDDYAYLAWGLIELYEATFQAEWLRWAVSLTGEMLSLFGTGNGALRFAPAGHEETLPVFHDAYDGAVPAGNSVAALNLLRLGRMTGRSEWEERGEAIIGSFGESMGLSPASFTMMLCAVDFCLGPTGEVVLAGATGSKQVERMAAVVREHYHPDWLVLFHPTGVERKEIESVAPFVAEMNAPEGQAAAYLCRNRSCQAPVNSVNALKELLEGARPAAVIEQ